jgi:hypothetical protein
MSDLGRTTPVGQNAQLSDRPGESTADQELVWPPSESEIDSYTFPQTEPCRQPVRTQVSNSIVVWERDPGQSTEQEESPEESAVESPVESPVESWVPVLGQTADSSPAVTPFEAPVAPAAGAPIPLLLSRVLHSSVSFHWHEAVAIVRQLADQLTRGLSLEPQGSIPGVDAIELEPTGRLRARLDPAGTVPAVRGLGYLLHVLLADTDAPARLRLIVSQAVSEIPTFLSVERLMWELAGFERPRRLETLKQVYERAADAMQPKLPVSAPGPDGPAVSRAAWSNTVARATEEADERTLPRRRLSWSAFTLALVAGAVGGALVFAAVTARSTRREAPRIPQAVAESAVAESAVPDVAPRDAGSDSKSHVESVVPDASRERTDAAAPDPARPVLRSGTSPGRERGRPQDDEAARPVIKSAEATYGIAAAPISERAQARPVAVQRSSLREVPQKAQREYRRARELFDQKDYAKAADGFVEVIKLLDDGELSPPVAELRSLASDYSVLSRATLSAITGGPVYRSGDEGVTEPVAVRQYLPDPPPKMPPGRLGVLFLVVDGQGAVESVRLESPSNRYHDRFWLSAAKTWRFKPAVRDGQPVKFLKRIVITEPPLSDPQ